MASTSAPTAALAGSAAGPPVDPVGLLISQATVAVDRVERPGWNVHVHVLLDPEVKKRDGESLLVKFTELWHTAVVNAANKELRSGGGVCGALHRKFQDDAKKFNSLEYQCKCARAALREVPPGAACVTFPLHVNRRDPASATVVHAVAPDLRRNSVPGLPTGQQRMELRAAHVNALKLCDLNGIETAVFPALGCGAYSYPPDAAAQDAMQAVRAWNAARVAAHVGAQRPPVARVVFVLTDRDTYDHFARALEATFAT